MKKYVSGVLLAAYACAALAETSISGPIDQVEFTVAGNPYIVESDVTVPAKKTVVIPQGCILLFRSFTGMTIKGRLVVDGKQDKPVVFTSIHDGEYNSSSSQLPNPFDWNGIFIGEESDGAFLNNFHLRYSVYGVKSQSQNVIIQNGVFRQNGQFHFTVNDEIQYVQDNIPFTYGEDEIPPSLADAVPGSASEQKDSGNEKRGSKRRAFITIGAIGAGVAAAAIIVPVLLLRDGDEEGEEPVSTW